MVAGILSGFISGLLLLFSFKGIYSRAEYLGIPICGTLGQVPLGHMSPLTALLFSLSALSLLSITASFFSTRKVQQKIVARGAAAVVALVAYVLILAYFVGLPLLYGKDIIPPALPTSLAFAALGAALLGFSGAQDIESASGKNFKTDPSYPLLMVFLVLAIGIITCGLLYHKNHENHYRAEVERQLSSIAELKVSDLMQWRRERLGDALLLHDNENFTGLVGRFLAKPDDADARTRLYAWLAKIQMVYAYDRVCLHDAGGVERMAVPAKPEPPASAFTQSAAEVLETKKVTFRDFYRSDVDNRIYLSVMAPILDGQNNDRTLGILALRIDPERFLYPLICRWPGTSHSGETLLLRKEGDAALFLNELRFQQNTALSLRAPLTRTEMPAVKAIRGEEGIVDGRDYRGVPVIADVRPVPDSPWFMVTRMDVSEIYAPAKERLWMMIVIITALLLGAGMAASLVWREQRVRFYRERYQMAETLKESEERYRELFAQAADPIAIVDPDTMRILEANGKASELLGYSRKELVQMKIPDLDVVESAKEVSLHTAAILKQEGDTFETRKKRRDGQVIDIEVTARAIKLGGKRVIQAVWRDITERKRAELEKQTLVEFLQLVNSSTDTRDLIERVVRFLQRQSGCEAVGVRLREADDYPYFEAKGFPREFISLENNLCSRDAGGNPIRGSGGNPVLECMCGTVICGRFDPSKPFFTANGSFWTNCTTQLLASTTEADRLARTRNRCNGEGYESVALVPLHVGNQRLGLLQLNDKRKGIFTKEAVALWERLAGYLAVAITKFRMDEKLEGVNAELSSKNKEMEQIIYVTSHDLRSPLVNVQGFSRELERAIQDLEMLLRSDDIPLAVIEKTRGILKGDIPEALGYIETGINKMDQLLSGLLKLSRMGRVALTIETIDMNRLIRNVIDSFEFQIKEKRVAVEVLELPSCKGDASQINQVFSNLLDNALKYAKNNRIASVRFSGTIENRRCVYCVEDNGLGIAPEHQQIIFEIFHRLNPEETQGEGLGLAIVQKTLSRLDGKVWVESELNKGSRFFVSLPTATKGKEE